MPLELILSRDKSDTVITEYFEKTGKKSCWWIYPTAGAIILIFLLLYSKEKEREEKRRRVIMVLLRDYGGLTFYKHLLDLKKQ